MPAKRRRCNTDEVASGELEPSKKMMDNKKTVTTVPDSTHAMMPPPPVPQPNQNIYLLPPNNILYPSNLQQNTAPNSLNSSFNDISNFYKQQSTRNASFTAANGFNPASFDPNLMYKNAASINSFYPVQQFYQPPNMFNKNASSSYLIPPGNTNKTSAPSSLKISSYYTLTPASSTSSLNDLGMMVHGVPQANASFSMLNSTMNTSVASSVSNTSINTRKRGTKTESGTTKRGRKPKTAVATTAAQNASIANESHLTNISLPVEPTIQTGEPAVKRRRGRPPKNSQPVQPTIIKPEPIHQITTNTTNNPAANKNTISSGRKRLLELYSTSNDDTATSKTPVPQLEWADGDELWRVMRISELKYQHDPSYMKRHAGIDSRMRAILLDWLMEVSHAYRLHRETYHLSIEYIDRFMTMTKQQIRVDRLQLIGMTCLFLAAKVEEIYPPKLKDLSSHMENYCNNNEEAMQQFELFVLKTLNWEISPVTANTWLQIYLQIAANNVYIVTCFNAINSASSAYYEEYNTNKHYILTSGEYFQKFICHQSNARFVLPLRLFRNNTIGLNWKSNSGKENSMNIQPSNMTAKQEQFYMSSYLKAVTLLDLCSFDMDSLKYKYSVLAASAMFHMLCNAMAICEFDLLARVVQDCTGYRFNELESCIQWMHPYADVCKEILTVEKITAVKKLSNVDDEDSHNIQLFNSNIELLKEAQSRKTPLKYYLNPYMQMLTPPESNRKTHLADTTNYSKPIINSYT